MKYITLPAVNKRVSLKAYIAGVKLAKQNPDMIFKHGLSCWWACSGADIMRQFRAGINDRINNNISYVKRGLK